MPEKSGHLTGDTTGLSLCREIGGKWSANLPNLHFFTELLSPSSEFHGFPDREKFGCGIAEVNGFCLTLLDNGAIKYLGGDNSL